jgi:hypothetical protein
MDKQFYLSKTFWLNLAAVVIAALEATEIKDVIPDTWEPSLVALVALINIVLRVYNTVPLTFRSKESE